MKLANALMDRSNLQQRLSELETRLNNNAKVQDGEEPAENPTELLSEIDSVINSLQQLIAKINLVNSTTLADGITVTELLAKRDCLSKRVGILRGFLNNASQTVNRYSKTEIAIKSTVSVSDLQKQLDRYAKELRVVDERIQEVNWTTEV